MILTETYIKKLIRQVLKENVKPMTVEKAIRTLEVIDQGYKPVGDDIKEIIALIKELDSKANPKV